MTARAGRLTLRGMTWSHPRGYLPLEAVSAAFLARTGVAVRWDRRSLQDFESFPVAVLAETYDLIVIDHPHVGQITAENCLAPLDVPGREAERQALAEGSIGQSYPSYCWQGRQWAFPIDAATQVLAYRPDRLAVPPKRWSDVLALARDGRVALPLRPPHTLMVFYTLAANLGSPCRVLGPDLIDVATGTRVLAAMRELVALMSPDCFEQDPIAVFEQMVDPASPIDCAPLIYGYVNYAMDQFRPTKLAFADIAALGATGPVGSALGGTGIAVSARSAHPEEALEFAYYVASGPVQRDLYALAGGQPGHAAAWEADFVNAPTHDFYRATRATLEGAFVRPRHDGYMAFQQAASELLVTALRHDGPAEAVVDGLNRLFAASFR